MTKGEWALLMRAARAHAYLHEHRTRVRSMRLMTPQAQERYGTCWVYAIDCPARARDFMRGH